MTSPSLAAEADYSARRQATRARILAAARDHAVKHGWRRTRVQDVAAEAGVSRPTLYKEFPSKEALGAALIAYTSDDYFARLRSALDAVQGGLRECFEAAALAAVRQAQERPFLAALITDDENRRGVVPGGQDMAARVLPHALEVQLPYYASRFPESDVARMSFAINALGRVMIGYILQKGPKAPPEEFAAQVAEMCALYVQAGSRAVDQGLVD